MVYSTGSIIIIVFKEHKNENMDIDYSYYLKENWNVTAVLPLNVLVCSCDYLKIML